MLTLLRKLLAIIAALTITLSAHGQQHILDSLNNLLNHAKDDTSRVILLDKMSYYDGNQARAFNSAYQALALARKIHYEKGEAKSFNQIGNEFSVISNYPKALEFYLAALKLDEKLGFVKGMVAVYGNIASVYKSEGNYNQALKYNYKALQFPAFVNDVNRALLYVNIAQCYEQLGKRDSVLVYAQRSYAYFEKTPDKYQESLALGVLGNINMVMGHEQLATAYYHMGIANAVTSNDTANQADCEIGLARLFKKMGKTDSALYYANHAVIITEKAKILGSLTNAATLSSELYEGRDPAISLRFYKMAMAARDSVFGAAKNNMIQGMTFEEQDRERQADERKRLEEEQRLRNIQYAAIAAGLVIFLVIFFMLSRSIIVSPRVIEICGVIGLLIFFEFINLVIHPYIASLTNESPLLMLLILVAIAAVIVPAHHRLEQWITHKLVVKNKAIKLAAAKKMLQKLGNEEEL